MASFDALKDDDLADVAHRVLTSFPPQASVRNQIQDELWGALPTVPVPRKFRRDIARKLDALDLFDDGSAFERLIASLFVIEDDHVARFTGAPNNSARHRIDRHLYQFRGDMQPDELFELLGAYTCSDRRFCTFIEGLTSAELHPDEERQRAVVAVLNEILAKCDVKLSEAGTDGGYPVFRTSRFGTRVPGRPKNIIFASREKPDLRFLSAVDNEIEVVTNAERVLIYERPIGVEGLRGSDLLSWWAEREQVPNDEGARRALYRRLQASIPENAPQQRLFFFRSFFSSFKEVFPSLPALLPEVWLHWDPKTVAERGPHALTRFRMDFLMLLPRGHRIVVEVDGKHHYAREDGRADPVRYGSMMAADRDLRLAGYEVYRFGTAELDDTAGPARVKEFFEALYKRHDVAYSV